MIKSSTAGRPGKGTSFAAGGSACSAATGFFVIGPSGFIRVCNHSQIELCHFRDIDNLKQNAYWQKFTQKAYLPRQCLPCPESGTCDGGCREEAHIIGGDVASCNVYASPAKYQGTVGCHPKGDIYDHHRSR